MAIGPVGVGLASGIDSGAIIDSLISLEGIPVRRLQTKLDLSSLKQEAYASLNGLALTAKLSIFDLASGSTFNQKTASSSNDSILSASALNSSDLGTYSFQVVQLASSSQQLSTGFVDRDTTAIGAGTMTIELGARKLDAPTALNALNGGDGIQRGKIQVTNGTKTEIIDLSNIITLEDAIDALNRNGLSFNVSVDRTYDFASKTFTSLDSGVSPGSGLGANLSIEYTGGGTLDFSQIGTDSTLNDLGFTGLSISIPGTEAGSDIFYVSSNTKLDDINDGFGVEFNASGTTDIRIVFDDGSGDQRSVEVDLTGSSDIGDVLNSMNVAFANGGFSADIQAILDSNKKGITFVDSGGVTTTNVSSININGSRASTDLGLTGGDGLIGELNGTLLRNINGGRGLGENAKNGIFQITSKRGEVYSINLNSAQTIQDVIRQINNTRDDASNTNTEITASINGERNGLLLTDTSNQNSSTFRVTDLIGNLAEQLGLETTFLKTTAAINTADDDAYTYLSSNDLSNLSESDLVGRMLSSTDSTGANVDNIEIIAYDSANNRVILKSESTSGTGTSGAISATAIRLSGVTGTSVQGKNLEARSISTSTRLSDLNGGQGIFAGSFSLSLSGGSAGTEINLRDSSIQTVQDVIDAIKSANSNVGVEINGSGDGLRIYDSSSSVTSFSSIAIQDLDNGSTAADLGLASGGLNRTTAKVESGSLDFYSYRGANTNTGDDTTLISSKFQGLDPSDVIGGIVSYDYGFLEVFATVTGYVASTGTLTVAAHSNSNGSGAPAANSADAAEIRLTLKEEFASPKEIGTINTGAPGDAAVQPVAGLGNFTLATISSLSQYPHVEQLIGGMITITASDDESKIGQTAMITDYDGGTGINYYTTGNFDIDASENDVISFSKKGNVFRYIGEDNTTGNDNNAFRAKIAESGFISFTAEIDAGTTATSIISDDFANLDSDKIIGALLTVADTNDNTREGDYAVVTGYDSSTNTITIDTLSDLNSATTTLTMLEGDSVHITYKSELVGAVIRSTAPTTMGTPDLVAAAGIVSDIGVSVVGGALGFSTVGESRDMLIGATITFTLNGNVGESRRIVDIVENQGGVNDVDYLIFDRALKDNVAAGDEFQISFSEIKATIKEVDFSRGVIETIEDMAGGIGNRDFDIIPVIDGSYQKDIEIESTDTLEDIVVKIKNANAGVNASILNDGSLSDPFKLSLVASNEGESGGISLSSTISGFDFVRSAEAKDAKLIMGGSSSSSSIVSSSSNSISDAITGLVIDLKQVSSDQVTLTVGHDIEGITAKAEDFLESFNILLASASDITAAERDVEVQDENGNTSIQQQKGLLFADSTTNSLINSIRRMVSTQVEGVASGSLQFLADVGFSFNTEGTQLEFDSSVFENALQTKFDQVENLFISTPNLMNNSGFGLSSDFLQSNFDINDIRNGKTSSSGFSENGNGSNGVKFQAGSTSKWMSISLGNTKTLKGIRLYHYVPTDLTATYSVSSAEAGLSGSTIAANSSGIDVLTDAIYLGADRKLIASQLKGATLTVGSTTSTIDSYEASSGKITLEDNAISVALEDPQVSGYTITTASGETLNFKYNFDLQYKDSSTGLYKTYQSFSNVTDRNFVFFPGGIRTDELRIIYRDNTGDSEDFTENGYFARLMEMEVQESQGLGAQFSRAFDSFTNGQTGGFKSASDVSQSIIDSLNSQIGRLNERIENKRILLVKQFANLEIVLATLSSQSSYLQSTLSGLPKAFSAMK